MAPNQLICSENQLTGFYMIITWSLFVSMSLFVLISSLLVLYSLL